MEILEYPDKLRMYNAVLVRANKTVEDTIKVGDKELFKDYTFDKYKSKKIYAEVVAVPFAIRPTRNHQTDHEWPKGTQSFGGDVIQLQIHAYQNVIRRRLQEKETKEFTKKYRSGPYEPEFTRNNEQSMLASAGDTAWFHYLALSDESYMGQDLKQNRYYKIPYEVIFCFTNDNVVKMANGFLQVEPYWDKDFDEIEVNGTIVRGKLKGNLVVGLLQAPEYLTGKVIKKGACFGSDTRSTIEDGDIILYEKGSEFKNVIQGKEVMLMQQWRIIAKMVGNKFMPVGDYVQITTTKIPPRKIILVDTFKRELGGLMEDVVNVKKDLEYLITPVGEVLAAGENCNYVNASSGKVYFNTSAKVFNLEDTIFLREGDISALWEGDYNIPTELRITI